MVLCYIEACSDHDLGAVYDHHKEHFGSPLHGYTCFLRPSTGRICIAYEGSTPSLIIPRTEKIFPKYLLSTIDSRNIIDTLTVEQYHEICKTALRHFARNHIGLPLTCTTAHLGAVYHRTRFDDSSSLVAIAPTLDTGTCLISAWHLVGMGNEAQHITENGWHRFPISELVDMIGFKVELQTPDAVPHLWLSQANHVLNWLKNSSNAEDYFLTTEVNFTVYLYPQPAVPAANWHSLTGFLFLCPPESFQIGPISFKCPEDLGYWSLDPSGMSWLSAEQAAELGFPAVRVRWAVASDGFSWYNFVYAGLGQFHQGKGFNPDSQDLARHLGHPLYELYSEYDDSMDVDDDDFEAHIEEVSSTDSDTDHPMDLD
ncbi:hypothetical protein R3P38DRAFT_3513775 [Favolaschia claudopus]|uniref:Uncharacterized protein n=1 Tax=Favolaschia claudopus TaxID=2862362 RepID=A0AAW0BS29_9AGAR